MTSADGSPPPPGQDVPPLPGGGEWRRLHPATPLLKGGIAFIAVVGFVLANLRERLVELVVGSPDQGDLLEALYERGHLGWAALIVFGGIALGVLGFYLSWRMHTFRINDEAVEVRSGILFRTHRQARLDRIQGVSITRPLFARLFGAARLELSVAGQDATVHLAYLPGTEVDRLRRDILALASARRAAEHGEQGQDSAAAHAGPRAAPGTDLITQRVSEFLAPELDPDAAPPESVVAIPARRLVGSILASGVTIGGVVVVVVLIVLAMNGRQFISVFLLVPGLIGGVGYVLNRVTKSLRFSIAATPDGIRIGYGLLTTANDTLPPGRIHAIEVYQPLLWRPAGWWAVRINRAGHASSGSAVQPATTMLPVGTAHDVEKVLGLLLPGLAGEDTRHLIASGMRERTGAGFVAAPRRGAWLRPFSWRRTGYAETEDAVLIRKGVVWRQLVVVPSARIQSLRLYQGPVARALDLTELTLHTVAGPVSARISILGRVEAIAAFHSISAGAVRAAAEEDESLERPA